MRGAFQGPYSGQKPSLPPSKFVVAATSVAHLLHLQSVTALPPSFLPAPNDYATREMAFTIAAVEDDHFIYVEVVVHHIGHLGRPLGDKI